MADLVVGLAKSAVEGTLSAAKSAIDEDEKLKKSMQRDLMLISDEFEMMRSFLNDANEHTAADETSKTLVRQVRNMALDMEDCIESAVLVDINKPHWWRRMIPSCMLAEAPAGTLVDAVATAQLLKSRLEAMGKRNERYMLTGGDSTSKPTEKTHEQAIADAAAAGILIEARNAKKKNARPRDLVELINSKNHVLPLQVISLWGAAGDLGVASIIKKTRDDTEMCSTFSCRAWVKLTQPFDSQEFIRSLMAQFYKNCFPQQGSDDDLLKQMDAMMAMDDTQLTKEFLKQVSDNRCLIFLEDVSTTVVWEAVRVYLPDKKNGSWIVVHTQQLEVASLVVGHSHCVLELEQFSADHSVCAFFNEKSSSIKELIELINKEHDVGAPLQVISMCGEVGDNELASIINKTCDEMCQKFRCRARVKLRHPFSHLDFIESLLAQILTNYCPRHGSPEDFLKLKGVKMITESGIIEEFVKQVMSGQRYLVLLEDVSLTDDWDTVRKYLPDANGSCIVVHTHQREVASFCAGQSHRLLELELFLAEHSVRVFIKEGEDEERSIRAKAADGWIRENPLIGRDADIDFLSSNYAGVQPVFGIAGVGKSYLVRHVYNKLIKEKTFQKFGWVDVTHPLNIRDFSWNLLLDLHSGSLQRGNMLRMRDPIPECRELLKSHPCLIVIDGLQSKEEWDSIKSALAFQHEENRSRIIVITYENSVATYCSDNSCWSVESLEIEEAYDLFKKTASTFPDSVWPSNPSPAYNERAKSVLHKCGGLPKVIVPVANFIADGWYWYPNLDCFMQVLETDTAFTSLKDLLSWVHSYFQSCQDSLKPCIFYLSIFPANHNIRRRRLVRRWIAEGYSTDDRESDAEEKGEKLFEDLFWQNMVQVPGSTSLSHVTRMSSCQVNSFIREYIISRSMEENLVFTLEGHSRANSQRSGRHLAIGRTWDRDMSVYQSIDLSRLRSLTIFGKWESFFISDKMKFVRVLDLEDASSVTDGDLKLIVKLLPRLKFLSLRRCNEITQLPHSFGRLRQLQTLDIRHTSIVKLPLSFTKLHKLQHISAGTTVPMDDYSSIIESLPPLAGAASASLLMTGKRDASLEPQLQLRKLWTPCYQRLPSSPSGGIELPRGVGKMMALHNISVIDIGSASGPPILKEVKELTQLRKFGVSGVKSENCKELCSAISGHPHLESLSVWLFDKNQGGCLDAVSPPPMELQSLKLYGHVGKLPAWINLLPILRKLKLRLTIMTQDDVDLLKDLQRLNTLCLCFSEFQHGELRFSGSWCFRQLLVLEIACNCMLKSVTFESSVMPDLEVLKIDCSNVSSLMFSGLQKLRDLREVILSGTYDDKVWQQLKSQLDEHQREIKPVLKPALPNGR